jgi:hypothetical protein
MAKIARRIFPGLVLALLLAACSQSGNGAVSAVENYLNALVNKDASRLSALSCADWEPSAQMELDSFQAIATRLEGLSCTATGTENDITLVNCQGKIFATYDNEDQEFDLSVRTYQVVDQGGEFLVCGYR